MEVHKFECSHGHEFYVPLNLPIDLTLFAEISKRMTCPFCQSEEINIYGEQFTVK